jgi:glycosyltransferase involved in cell wall biosynthesis
MTVSAFMSGEDFSLGRSQGPSRAAASHTSQQEIVLDISRLLSRVLHPTPTGVDRVEMAYAQGLLRLAPDRLLFSAIHLIGFHGRLETTAAVDFIHSTAERWKSEGQGETTLRRWRRAVAACMRLMPVAPPRHDGQRIYLHCSARGLERYGAIANILARERARFVPFVHDLIPLEYPEYARPAGAALFQRKLKTVTTLASGILVNSEATKRALLRHLARSSRTIPICVAPLGVSFGDDAVANEFSIPTPEAKPYFLAIATIEPRKNHLLLLHLWRRLSESMKRENIPKLILVGRRGWENEMVLDLLDRAPALSGIVEERSRVPDRELVSLIRGARALLMPSFAEGYGMPVADALALGTPVIASDLPAHRETGCDVAEYLDPLDGATWIQAISDYALESSLRRSTQLLRLKGWQASSWNTHLATVLDFITEAQR